MERKLFELVVNFVGDEANKWLQQDLCRSTARIETVLRVGVVINGRDWILLREERMVGIEFE